MTTQDLTIDWDDFKAVFKSADPEPDMTFADDPVALACCVWRQGMYMDLADAKPTSEDRELAVKVRQHFVSKLTMERLQNDRVTAFRQKLGAFLVGNHQLLESELGLLYRLPYFYFEDLFQQELINTVTQIPLNSPTLRQIQLQPLSVTVLKRRNGDVRQFWWIDNNRQPYCLSVRSNSDNQAMYQSIWEFHSIAVEAQLFVKPFLGTDRYYYKLVGAKLLGVTSHND
jgi:hypothetical protein